MRSSPAEFARSVVMAYLDLDGFEVTENIQAGPVQVTARIRLRKPDMRAVEFQAYRSPFLELEERLTNGAEFTEDELAGMSFAYDGRDTLVFDSKSSIAIRKPSRSLVEPLPGFFVLGEIGFLGALTHDFLVRDAGEEVIEGNPARLLGLKPKQGYRSYLLKAVTFPIRRAVVAFAEDSKFPQRIEFFPSHSTILSSLIGPRDPVTITYRDVRLEPPHADAFSLSPPAGSRIFREEFVRSEDLAERLPFVCSIDPLLQRGYRLPNGGGTILIDEASPRGNCTLSLRSQDDSGETHLLTLRAGNFLSRNMSRRKATIAETGTVARIGQFDGWVLDRANEWAQEIPEGSPRKALEASWAQGDVFWFLAADGLDEEELIELASALASQQSGS